MRVSFNDVKVGQVWERLGDKACGVVKVNSVEWESNEVVRVKWTGEFVSPAGLSEFDFTAAEAPDFEFLRDAKLVEGPQPGTKERRA